jgi:site-specific recombinase XerC
MNDRFAPSREKRGPTGWKARLQALINEHGGKRVNGKPASFRTQELTATTLFSVFKTLHDIGFRLEEPHNFSERHVLALVTHWHHKGHAIGTIQNTVSVLRKFCIWIGKKGMIKPLPKYLKDVPPTQLKRHMAAEQSKSWTEAGIDIEKKIAEADALDARFGLMLRITSAFGLREKECVMFRPWKGDLGDCIAVYGNAGPKGGKARMVPVENKYQRTMLDYVKSQVSKRAALGWTHTRRGKRADLKYQCAEWQRRMQEIGITRKLAGVTGHGLRAEFAENAAMLRGVMPPVLDPSGRGGAMDGVELSLEEINLARTQVSEMLGHSRLNVTNAYYGAFKLRTRPESKSSPELPGRATPRPRGRVKVSVSGSDAIEGTTGVRKRTGGNMDACQMDLPLKDGVLMFRKRPK